MTYEILFILACIVLVNAKAEGSLKCYVCEDCANHPPEKPKECTRDGLFNVGPGLMTNTVIEHNEEKSESTPLFDCQRVEAKDKLAKTIIVSKRCQYRLNGNDTCKHFYHQINEGGQYENATCSVCSTDACNYGEEMAKLWPTLIISAFIFSCSFIITA